MTDNSPEKKALAVLQLHAQKALEQLEKYGGGTKVGCLLLVAPEARGSLADTIRSAIEVPGNSGSLSVIPREAAYMIMRGFPNLDGNSTDFLSGQEGTYVLMLLPEANDPESSFIRLYAILEENELQ